MSPLARLGAYTAHPDRRTAACNTIAMVITGNQPLYPFFVMWFVGGDAWSTCWTFLSTPFFALVPWVARRNSQAARVLLPLAGIANTALSIKAFGVASAVAWFLVPCVLITVLALRKAEALWAAALIVLAAVVALLRDHFGAPLGVFSHAEQLRFAHLNLWSVVTLTAFAVWKLGTAIRAEGRSALLYNIQPLRPTR